MIDRVVRLWHTVRHLRAGQLWGRLVHRVYRPRPDPRPGPAVSEPEAPWQGCAREPSMTAENRFRFLGVERELATPADWQRSEWGRLWLYNLHYFDDLVADGAGERAEWHRVLIGRWLSENPPGRGVGWEPYPTSLRIVNWIKWGWSGRPLTDEAIHSLAVQARWLSRRLEFHLLGNHLWANAKALVFAGAFFDGPEAERWCRRGLGLIRRELVEQILPDGGHFELSPMYHAIVLEDLLDLIQLARVRPGSLGAAEPLRWADTASRMRAWLAAMTHADGEPAFFNDTALGIAAYRADLEAYAAVLDLEPVDNLEELLPLPDSGYVRLQAGAASLIADVGPIGPDYLPGHAHADSLSFELTLGAHRVFVNAGISTYEDTPERWRQRGTAAHNTVVVDEQNSSEVWSSFRVARRARPCDVSWGSDGEELRVEGGHTGYRRLPGRVTHRRRWSLEPARLTVRDRIEGTCRRAVARYRLHPEFRASLDSDHAGSIRGYDRVLEFRASTPARIVEESWYPGFNRSLPCQVIELPIEGGGCELELSWRGRAADRARR